MENKKTPGDRQYFSVAGTMPGLIPISLAAQFPTSLLSTNCNAPADKISNGRRSHGNKYMV